MGKGYYVVLVALTIALSACERKPGETAPSAQDNGPLSSLTSSSYKEEYPPEVVTNFMNACVASGSSSQACGCRLGKIQDKIPYADYVKAETNALAGQGFGDDFVQVMADARVACP
jgi:hypothetical protein